MTIYSFPKVVSLVREKHIKLHLPSCKVIVTQAGRMMLVSPVFGMGMYGTFFEANKHGHNEEYAQFHGRFQPNKVFFQLPQKEAKQMLNDLGAVEEFGLAAVKKIGLLTGNCCICGRTLTAEGSIEDGIGPICAGKVGGMW